MIKLNLTAENDCHQAIKDYLEENASELLAEKINNGVKIQKDEKSFINKKTLAQFWAYASKKAQEQKTGYVANEAVFGWAMHYFEESEIIGTLYNEDGSEYQPPKPEYKPVHTPTVSPKTVPPKPKQASLFDFLSLPEEPPKDEPTEEPDDEVKEDPPCKPADNFTVDENGEIIKPHSEKQYRPTSVYQKYLDMQKQYPHAVIAYRLGDFYEIFGDNAIKIANALSLTLTGRDCGLENRVPMIGFPYHSAEAYFQKIQQRYSLVVMDLDGTKVLEKLSAKNEQPKPTPVPPTIVKEPEPAPVLVEDTDENDDIEVLRAQTKHIDKDALCVLLELFDYELDVQ